MKDEIDDIANENCRSWIKVKKVTPFLYDNELALFGVDEEHHKKETEFLIAKCRELARDNKELKEVNLNWEKQVKVWEKDRDGWRDTALQAVKLLNKCHPSKIWDYVRMFYSDMHRGVEIKHDNPIRKHHYSNCEEVTEFTEKFKNE